MLVLFHKMFEIQKRQPKIIITHIDGADGAATSLTCNDTPKQKL